MLSQVDLLEYAKTHLQFRYEDASCYSKFNLDYSTEGWFQRKLIALPLATYSATVRVVYHVVLAIIGGLKGAPSRNKYLQAHIFYIIRDVQESWGWLRVLFDDKKGQCIRENSLFNRECYQCFLANLMSLRIDPNILPSDSSARSKSSPISEQKDASTTEAMVSVLDRKFAQMKALVKVERSEVEKLASSYLEIGIWEKFVEVMKLVDRQIQESFICKLGKRFCGKGDLHKALEISKSCSSPVRAKFLASIASLYFTRATASQWLVVCASEEEDQNQKLKNEEEVRNCLRVLEELVKEVIKKVEGLSNEGDDFIAHCARTCYEQKEGNKPLLDRNVMEILDAVHQIALKYRASRDISLTHTR